MAHPRAFTAAETAFVKTHWASQWPEWIAARLQGRTAQAVRTHAERLGLPKTGLSRPPVQRQAQETDWTPARIDTLKEMWAKGYASRVIANRLGGVSRNAVIGKARRLGLPAHPEQSTRPASTPPAGAALGEGAAAKTCQWPIGHPGQPGFRFCGDPVATDKPHRPYCPDHCAAAYREKLTPREREANVLVKRLLKAG